MSLLVNIDKSECSFNFITHTINLMEEYNDNFGDDITHILQAQQSIKILS